jgi:hypothetical protein
VADQNAAVTRAFDVTATTPHLLGITPPAGAWRRGGIDGINCTTGDVTRHQTVAVRGSWHIAISISETMTMINKTKINPRKETLFVKRAFLARDIAELETLVADLESRVQEFELEDQEAEKSAKYLGSGRWEYRDSYIEGMWSDVIGEYEFLAMSALVARQFQTFSQATTWLDGVDAGAAECRDLMRKPAQ